MGFKLANYGVGLLMVASSISIYTEFAGGSAMQFVSSPKVTDLKKTLVIRPQEFVFWLLFFVVSVFVCGGKGLALSGRWWVVG